MASMRSAAASSYADKMGRMGLATGDGKGDKIRTAAMGEDVGEGHTGSADDGSLGMNSGGRATGYATAAENEATMAEKKGKPRLDRKGYKKGGRVGTTVNVIVASTPKPEAPPMPPPGVMPPPPPPEVPMGPPPGAGGPPGGMPMMRKHGGRVPHMKAGAGGGEGRLQKIKSYGNNARP